MSSRLLTCLAAVLAVLAPAAASAQVLTRIETNNFYGATVTIEEGVRVFRGLPPASHVVINPGGRTPLTLSYNNTTIVDNSGGDTEGTVGYAAVPRVNYGWGYGYGYGRRGVLRRNARLVQLYGRGSGPRIIHVPGRAGGRH